MLDQTCHINRENHEFLADVLNGLRKDEKSIPSKYFYDEQGSRLFERICKLEEYYLTNCELQIMEEHGEDIARCLLAGSTLVEFGSGSSLKTRHLLDALSDTIAYVPVDLSADHLHNSVAFLRKSYPNLKIDPVVADFTKPIPFPTGVCNNSPVTVYFPGSTIGNFSTESATELLKIIVNEIGDHGGLILGIDLQKSQAVLEAAYNDKQGVTAEFNLNLLRRINRELNGSFDLDQFKHQSVYNAEFGRIETHIVSCEAQIVSIAGEEFEFFDGEEILTEYSYKYRVEEFVDFAESFGLCLRQSWTDDRSYFAVLHLTLD